MDASTLRSLRSITARFLTDTCTIERRAKGVGKYGQETNDYAVVAQRVPCRVITTGTPTINMMGKAGEQAGLRIITKLIVAADTDLQVNDHVIVNGGTFNIVDLLDERSQATDKQAILERWQAA